MITIEFREERYAIRTSNGMYLNRDGKLVPLPSEDTLFSIEFHKGCVAFKVTYFMLKRFYFLNNFLARFCSNYESTKMENI